MPKRLFKTAIILSKKTKINYDDQFKINKILKEEIKKKQKKYSIKRKKEADRFFFIKNVIFFIVHVWTTEHGNLNFSFLVW